MEPASQPISLRNQSAEREGFEPPVPCGTPDFESGTFDHSDTSPGRVESLTTIINQSRYFSFKSIHQIKRDPIISNRINQ